MISDRHVRLRMGNSATTLAWENPSSIDHTQNFTFPSALFLVLSFSKSGP